MRLLFVILIGIVVISCKEKKPQENQEQEIDTTALAKTVSLPKEEVILLPEAREQAVKWVNYITAQNEITNLQSATLSEVVENARPLAQIMESLQNTVPDTLQSRAVNSRLNVLVTKAKILEQLAARREKNPEEIAKTVEEIPVEFNNFKLQLNELFLKSLEDFEEELDEMEAPARDSIPESPRDTL